MRTSGAIWSLLALACGDAGKDDNTDDLIGQWQGVCELRVGQDERSHSLEIEIDNVEEDDIDGFGRFLEDRSGDGLDSKLYEGPVHGSRHSSHVTITLALDGEDLMLEGEHTGTTMMGVCQWGPTTGEFELERID